MFRGLSRARPLSRLEHRASSTQPVTLRGLVRGAKHPAWNIGVVCGRSTGVARSGRNPQLCFRHVTRPVTRFNQKPWSFAEFRMLGSLSSPHLSTHVTAWSPCFTMLHPDMTYMELLRLDPTPNAPRRASLLDLLHLRRSLATNVKGLFNPTPFYGIVLHLPH